MLHNILIFRRDDSRWIASCSCSWKAEGEKKVEVELKASVHDLHKSGGLTMSAYLNYDERAADCVRLVQKVWPNSVERAIFNSDERWYWRNIDGDFFLHDTQAKACADFCREAGVTTAELDSMQAAETEGEEIAK